MSNEQQNKIVAFPLLKERLVEKATDHMQHKQSLPANVMLR